MKQSGEIAGEGAIAEFATACAGRSTALVSWKEVGESKWE